MNVPRILVVDDDERNIRLLATLLEGVGYQALSATGGQEACRRIEADPPHLVLLDAMMPEMNGFDVCAWIRSRPATALLPVVMVTALTASEEKVRALEAGADDFISKPINRLELLARVRSLLRVQCLQEDLARKNDALQRAESLRESLVQMIIHDLKNPLSGIQGYAEILSSSVEAGPRVRQLAASMRTACRTMMAMILDMLDVGRMEEGCDVVEARLFDLVEVLREDVNDCKGFAQAAGVDLELSAEHDVAPVHADPALVRRVIANLLNNAVKHTPPGGRVIVGTRREEGHVEVSVTDTGEGIPSEDLERIFDKFARVSGQRRGTRQDRGLGLTFCRMAVEAHGSAIRVSSTPGKGSSFTFRLPVAAADQRVQPAGARA